MITYERLNELLEYYPNSGGFLWKTSRRGVSAGSVAGTIRDDGYIKICLDRRIYFAHRLAFLSMTGKLPTLNIDHINGNTSDNRWCNLREATYQENGMNRSQNKNNKTGVKNVRFTKGAYQVDICIDGDRKYLGRYEDLELADLVAQEARSKYHGKFASS